MNTTYRCTKCGNTRRFLCYFTEHRTGEITFNPGEEPDIENDYPVEDSQGDYEPKKCLECGAGDYAIEEVPY